MYEFSAPVLYDKEDIDYITELNNKLTKSKIVTLYNSMPSNAEGLSGLEQTRGVFSDKIKNLKDYCKYIKYITSKGFNFVYLLNTTRALEYDNLESRKNLETFVKSMQNAGCNSFRVGNTLNIQYLIERFPDIDIRTSTTLGYTNINQYINLKNTYSNISEFCLHYENNHDFKLLKNLVKNTPQITKEILVNELCIKGCPYRNSHYSFLVPDISSQSDAMHRDCFFKNCTKIVLNNLWEYVCKSNFIYPWQIKEYAKLGINNFKLAGRGSSQNKEYLYRYLRAVEDEEFMMNLDFFSIFDNASYDYRKHYAKYPSVKIRDILEYLPKIEYFRKIF